MNMTKVWLFLLLQLSFILQLSAAGSVGDIITLTQSMGTLLNQNAQPWQLDSAGNNAVSALRNLGSNSPGITLSTCSQTDFNAFVTRLLAGFTTGIMGQVNQQNSASVKNSLQSAVPGVSRGANNAYMPWWSHGGVAQTDATQLATQISILSASLGALIEQAAPPAYEDQVVKGVNALQALYNSQPTIAGGWTNLAIDNMTIQAYQQLGYDFVGGIVDATVSLQINKLNQQALANAAHNSGVGPVIATNVNRVNPQVRPDAFTVAYAEVGKFFTETIGQNVQHFFVDTVGGGVTNAYNQAMNAINRASSQAASGIVGWGQRLSHSSSVGEGIKNFFSGW